jgi:hypothetical protein
MSPERTAALITISIVLGAVVLFVAFAAYSNYERYRPQIAEPLVVGFKVATGNGDYKYTNVGVENDKVASLKLPTNSHIEFNYLVACGGNARYTQHNVTLYLDYVSEGLQFLDKQNQTYIIPNENEIGTMEINTAKQFEAFIETPTQKGIYQMQWHITSDNTSYPFIVRIWVTE